MSLNNCTLCEFKSSSEKGLKIHFSKMHKNEIYTMESVTEKSIITVNNEIDDYALNNNKQGSCLTNSEKQTNGNEINGNGINGNGNGINGNGINGNRNGINVTDINGNGKDGQEMVDDGINGNGINGINDYNLNGINEYTNGIGSKMSLK